VSFKSLVLIVISICSVFAVYHFQNTPNIEGRDFRLTLHFQNSLNRVVKDSEYAIELPYGFVAQPGASVSAQTIGFGERRVQLFFGETPKYAGQTVVIEGVITNAPLPDITTTLSSCLHPLTDKHCSKLIEKDVDPAELTLLVEQSFKENEQLLLSEGLDRAKWQNLIELFRLAHLKQAEGNQIRIIRGVDSTSGLYKSEIWLEIKKQEKSTWLPIHSTFTNEAWLATYVYPDFGASIPDSSWMKGYGLTLVDSALEITTLPVLNK
jgi:hypothetical protein